MGMPALAEIILAMVVLPQPGGPCDRFSHPRVTSAGLFEICHAAGGRCERQPADAGMAGSGRETSKGFGGKEKSNGVGGWEERPCVGVRRTTVYEFSSGGGSSTEVGDEKSD